MQCRGTLGKRITHISTSGLLVQCNRLIMDNVSYKGLTATAPTRVSVGVYRFLQVHTVLAEGRAATALILISIGDQSWASVWLSVRHCPLLSPSHEQQCLNWNY